MLAWFKIMDWDKGKSEYWIPGASMEEQARRDLDDILRNIDTQATFLRQKQPSLKIDMPIKSVVRKNSEQQILSRLKEAAKRQVLNERKKQQKPKGMNKKAKQQKGQWMQGGRQNQTRQITDVPLGTSQRNGFNRNTASITVSKDEYIADIAGTVAFTSQQFNVNPGQANVFPWLSDQAKQWEKYMFTHLEFYLKPEVTQYTTNANSGKVILSFDSDASDPPPLNKQEAEDILPMADGMSYQTVNLNIPKFILNQHLDSYYVRVGNLPGGSDIKTYDLGNLFVSTVGQGGAVPNMMELRVKYTCVLMIPILENTAAAPQNNTVSLFQSSGPEAVGASGVSQNMLFATAVTNGLKAVNTAGSILLPPGNYLIDTMVTYDGDPNTRATTLISDLQVSGVSVYATGVPPQFGPITGALGIEQITLNQAYYVALNGSQPLTFPVTGVQTGATAGFYGTLRITAV
jgi:hypothetical protein